MNKRNKKWYDKHGKKYAARYRAEKPYIKKKIARTYYENNKELIKIKSKLAYEKRKKENPDEVARKAKDLHLRRTYGISLDHYNLMLFSQNGLCKICKGRTELSLFVDHCHKTNKVRGLLCITCNTVIGHYEKYKKQIEEYL